MKSEMLKGDVNTFQPLKSASRTHPTRPYHARKYWPWPLYGYRPWSRLKASISNCETSGFSPLAAILILAQVSASLQESNEADTRCLTSYKTRDKNRKWFRTQSALKPLS